MQLNNKNPKQRRYIRYAIELKAVLVIDEVDKFECIILDFCSHGLFLRITQQSPDIALPKNVKIQFTIQSELGNQKFEIDAQLMHNTPNGVGVLIDNMPLATFNALKSQTLRATNPSEDAGEAAKKFNHGNFKRFFKQALVEHLAVLINSFLETVGDNLERTNAHGEYFANRSELDDLVTTLHFHAETSTSEFCHSVIDQVNWITRVNQKKEDDSNFDRALSLVEKEDFEDWLTMSSIIRKLSNHYEEQINQITRELSRIYGRSKLTINNPISPAILCDSFRELVLQFELDNNINKALYICFGKSLFDLLTDFYQQVNSILTTQESAEQKLLDTNSQPYKNSNKNRQFVDSQEVLPKAQKAAILPNSYSIDESLTHQHQPSVTKITGKLLDLLKEAEATNTADSDKVLYDDVGHNYSQANNFFDKDEIVTAVTQIQNEGSSDIHQDYAALQERIQEVLKSLSNKSKIFSHRDSSHLDVYGRFFETLFKDPDISPELKPYLESIHLPLLTLPLQGEDFLDADSHPAKNILNKLASLGHALKGSRTPKNNKIKDFLRNITTRIAQEAHINPNILNEVEKELDVFSRQITKSIDSRVQHVIEAHEGQQKLAMARQAIQAEIDQRFAGRAVPTVIPMLLDAGWQHLLVLAELNKEKQSDNKDIYLNVLDDLMFWLYEQDSILKIQASSIQTTITFIEDKLTSTGTSHFERKQVIEELTALLLGVGTPKVRKTIQTAKFAEQNPEEASTFNHADDVWESTVNQLAVGEWLKIKQDSDKFEHMKVVWIGGMPLIYVLVNPDGLKNLEFNKNDLTTHFRQGSVEKAENLDLPLTERTTNSMLQGMHDKFVFNATHDPETNLITRDEFIKQLKVEIPKLNETQHILCHIEILDFRVITNICGLSGSKEMLQMITRLMTDQVRTSDLFARLGDNSFAILYKNCAADEAYDLSTQLINQVSNSHFQWQEKSLPITLSMGLAPFTDNSIDIYQLLQQADAASLSAERSGHNNVLVYAGDDENLQQQNKLLEWIGKIDSVFSQDRLFARCQMITTIEPTQESHIHYEILLGIKDEEGNIIPPDHFIPAVERCKRMHEIDKWVINTVFDWIEHNRESFDNMDGFSINLSGQSINNVDFLQFLQTLLGSCSFPLDKLVFEITETVASENLAFTKKFIKTIKEFGCKFSLDDFGSGYSSYAYLKNMNVDFLKIDGAFVKDLATNKADLAIVKSMNEIAHSLGLKTIAEYVENAEIKEVLKEIGVDYGQGYFIHKPMPLSDLKVEVKSETELFYFEDNSFWDI